VNDIGRVATGELPLRVALWGVQRGEAPLRYSSSPFAKGGHRGIGLGEVEVFTALCPLGVWGLLGRIAMRPYGDSP